MRPLVHDPTNTASTAMSRIAVPGRRSMYANAFSAACRSASSVISCGSGTAAASGTPWPGLVPQVTNGLNDAASRYTSVSKTAPTSVRSRCQ
ncbi:Uncharacterised protein [Mycobacterium tuberculosis]|nr:Uncharacterised protein [Mycobacterium tuberculosis]